jgi:ubiquinone biosynthesis protein
VIENLAPELMMYRPHIVVDELERKILREMDFINEAATISRFTELFGEDECFQAPRVFWDLTGPRVLTLGELTGITMQKLLTQPDPAIDRNGLAVRLVEAFLKQFFEMGLFHADPHPGNLLIEPPCKIGLIDFGLTGLLDDELKGNLVVMLTGAFNREPDVIVEVLADMNIIDESADRGQMRREFTELIDKYYGLPLHRFNLQTLYFEVSSLIRRNRVTLPREFVLFGKALVAVGGICLQLDPALDLVGLTKPRIRRLVYERFSPGHVIKSATISSWHMFNVLRKAPSQLRDISRRLASGRWQVTLKHRNLDELAHEIDKASNRLGFAIVIGAIIMGSSWVLGSDANLFHVPLRILGVVGYVMAGFLGLALVYAIFRSGRLY